MKRSIKDYSDEELLTAITTPRKNKSVQNKLSSMSDEELLAKLPPEYLQSHETPKGEEESLLSQFGRGTARLAKDIPVGLLSTADFIATPVRTGMNAISGAIGGNPEMFKPVSGQLNTAIDTATQGYTKPQNLTEQITSGITQDLSSMSPARAIGKIILKGGQHLSKFARGTGELLTAGTEPTLTNIGATTAGISAREKMLEEDPNNVGNALAAEILTNLGTRGAIHATGSGNMARSIGKKLKFNRSKFEDMQKTGMPSTFGDVSDSKTVKAYENILRKTPFAGSIIDDVIDKQKRHAEKILHQDLGSQKLNKEYAGKLAEEAAKTGKTKYDKFANHLWDKIESSITHTPNKTIKTPATNKFISKFLKEADSSEGSKKLFKESPLGQAIEDFENLHITPRETKVINGEKVIIGGEPKAVTPHELINFKRALDRKVKTFGLHGDIKEGRLKMLDGKLQQDLHNYFKDISPEALENWSRFNKFTKRYIKHDKPIYNKITKHIEAEEPAKAYNVIEPTNESIKATLYAMRNLKEKSPELLGNILNDWGKVGNRYEPLRAGSAFLKMDKPLQDKLLKGAGYSESQQNIFRKNLESMEYIRAKLNETNTSGTSYFENYRKTAARWTAAVSALVGKTTDPSLVLIPIAYTVGSRMAAKAYVSPKVQAWIYKGMTAKSDKMIPKWLEMGTKLPGIPTHIKDGFKDLYMQSLEAERKNALGAFRKGLPSILESVMTRSDKEEAGLDSK